jgi:hypothetical protein
MLSDYDVIEPARVHVFIAHKIISWSFFFLLNLFIHDFLFFGRDWCNNASWEEIVFIIIGPAINTVGESYCQQFKNYRSKPPASTPPISPYYYTLYTTLYYPDFS